MSIRERAMRLATKTALLPAQTDTESTLFGERDGFPTRAGSAVLGDRIVRVMRTVRCVADGRNDANTPNVAAERDGQYLVEQWVGGGTQFKPFFIEDAADGLNALWPGVRISPIN